MKECTQTVTVDSAGKIGTMTIHKGDVVGMDVFALVPKNKHKHFKDSKRKKEEPQLLGPPDKEPTS